jgi:hypothetical protein
MVHQLLKEYSDSRGLKVGLMRAASQRTVISQAASSQENVVNVDEEGKLDRKATIRRSASQRRGARKRGVHTQRSSVNVDEGKTLRLRAGLARTASQRRTEVNGVVSERGNAVNFDKGKFSCHLFRSRSEANLRSL